MILQDRPPVDVRDYTITSGERLQTGGTYPTTRALRQKSASTQPLPDELTSHFPFVHYVVQWHAYPWRILITTTGGQADIVLQILLAITNIRQLG